jgi:hypothetical protein
MKKIKIITAVAILCIGIAGVFAFKPVKRGTDYSYINTSSVCVNLPGSSCTTNNTMVDCGVNPVTYYAGLGCTGTPIAPLYKQ